MELLPCPFCGARFDPDPLLAACKDLLGIAQASIVNARNRGEYPQIIAGLVAREAAARAAIARAEGRGAEGRGG